MKPVQKQAVHLIDGMRSWRVLLAAMPHTFPATNSAATAVPPRSDSFRYLLAAAVVFGFSLAMRLPYAGQSLWGDEMETFLDYMIAPTHKVLAANPGEYIPNNHVLFTILAKAIYSFASTGETGRSLPNEVLIRLPSLICGALLPVALAWPFRRRAPLLAVSLALLSGVHPWLIAFSDEARGYSLMVLLGVIATNLLPDGTKRWPISYSLTVAAALYTVQVALILVIAHGLTVSMLRRNAFSAWMRGTLIAIAITALLYLPMAQAVIFYYQHPLPTPDDYVDFINQLPRFALWGQYLPHPPDALTHRPDPSAGIVFLVIPVIIMLGGLLVLRHKKDWTIPPLAIGLTAPVALVLAIPIHSAGQVRFVPWSAVWVCFSLSIFVQQVRAYAGVVTSIVCLMIVAGVMACCDFNFQPNQQTREAFVIADQNTPPGEPIIDALLTAPQAVALYGPLVSHHNLTAAATIPAFLDDERQCIATRGHRPCVIMSYEYLVRDLQPDFWKYFNTHYQLIARLPGRISPVSIYQPTVAK